MMEENHNQLVIDTKELLTNFYKYSSEQIKLSYPVHLTDGNTILADLVLTSGKEEPHTIIFITKDSIPEEKVKTVLSKSRLLYGIIRNVRSEGVPEFWGIKKKRSIFGNIEFTSILDYPRSTVFSELSYMLFDLLGFI